MIWARRVSDGYYCEKLIINMEVMMLEEGKIGSVLDTSSTVYANN